MVLRKLYSHMQINEIGSLTYTIQKNQLKMDQRLQYKTWNYKDPGRKHGENASGYWSWQLFHWYDSKAQATKGKINECDYIKLKICTKGNKEQSEKATYEMGENICKLYIR